MKQRKKTRKHKKTLSPFWKVEASPIASQRLSLSAKLLTSLSILIHGRKCCYLIVSKSVCFLIAFTRASMATISMLNMNTVSKRAALNLGQACVLTRILLMILGGTVQFRYSAASIKADPTD